MISLVLAVFLVPGAKAATSTTITTADPAAPGTQSASGCADPKLAKLPKKVKVGQQLVVKATGLLPGTQWLLRIAGHDWASGVADGTTVRQEQKLVDLGLNARQIKIDMVLANETCENSPWKLTRKTQYAGRFNGHPPPAPQSNPAPTATTPAPIPTPAPATTGKAA